MKKESNFKYISDIWGWDEDYQQEDFTKDFNFSDFSIIVFNNNDIGFIQINESENTINITEIHINANFRGKGLGSSIIREIIQNGISKGKKIQIGCFKANERAFNLYRCLGFKTTASTETHHLLSYSIPSVKTLESKTGGDGD